MIDPGATATAMRAAAYPGENPDSLPTAQMIAPAFVWLLSPQCATQGHLYLAHDLLNRL